MSWLLECAAMDAVYLTSDILIHYFLSPNEPESHEWGEAAELRQQRFDEALEQYERAGAVMRRVYNDQVTAYLSDFAIIEAVKAFEKIPFTEKAEWEPVDPENPLSPIRAQFGFKNQKVRDTAGIQGIINNPNVAGVDEYKWSLVFRFYVENDLPIEAAYEAATFHRLNRTEGVEIAGIVSFNEDYDRLEDIPRIDPAFLSGE